MNQQATDFLKSKFYSGQITGDELMRRVEAEVRREVAAEIEQLRGERGETAKELQVMRDTCAGWKKCDEETKHLLATVTGERDRLRATPMPEPKGVDLHVRMALSCLEELEPTAMRRKQKIVPNFNEHMERESQLSAARVSLDLALAALNP